MQGTIQEIKKVFRYAFDPEYGQTGRVLGLEINGQVLEIAHDGITATDESRKHYMQMEKAIDEIVSKFGENQPKVIPSGTSQVPKRKLPTTGKQKVVELAANDKPAQSEPIAESGKQKDPIPKKAASSKDEKPKKKRGRPRKKRLTDEEVLSSVETTPEPPVATEPVEDEVIYHEPCKTCRKSRRNAEGKYPACNYPMFSIGSSGIETCALWWERR